MLFRLICAIFVPFMGAVRASIIAGGCPERQKMLKNVEKT